MMASYDVGGSICGCWCRIIGDLESGTDKEDEVLVGFKGWKRLLNHL
jgi:hypothetical protein